MTEGSATGTETEALDGMDALPDLRGLSLVDWRAALAGTAEAAGDFQPLGVNHAAALIETGRILLVTFEDEATIRARPGARPLGWAMVERSRWSHLALISHGQSWFRDPAIHAYFDRLGDDGFFEDFTQVIFYGAGPAGYAACACSLAAPGARVLAIAPQATLDPARAGWDHRYRVARRLSFSGRYGYGPDMLDAADRALLLFDPHVCLDAAHAALYHAPHVHPLRLPCFGTVESIENALLDLGLWQGLLHHLAQPIPKPRDLAGMLRARRTYPPYLLALLRGLDHHRHPRLNMLLFRHIARLADTLA
ncbi:phosphoadenosine phosphosulfate reductase [Pseudooceanicola algae]|uniref:Phosphoadenosine phosphosulfate reductase n=1 Tax=Pseudooceanicola algae TaxID=1537215 RepID=A0A418SF14_9RHOB|nr:phosphoadenosine phosphosulfate reductase [Pseudooceanicola algae]QPM89323.1 hypothetical protein PSAL_005380 [Pseudooceanicola algae]